MSFNVLQVTPQLDAGGVERTTIEVAEALTAAGHGAFVFSAGGRLEHELARVGGRLLRGPAASKDPRVILGSNVRRLRKLIARHDIHLVHARSRGPAWSALLAARATKTPFVTTYHGIYNGEGALKRFYNGVMARGDLVIANSEHTRDHVVATHKLDPARIRVIPRGVDVDVFTRAAVSPERIEALRDQWRLSRLPPLPVVMLPGRLTAWKGQTVLIEAVAKLRQQGLDCRALLVGDPQGRADYALSLDRLARERGVADLVMRTGHCADMAAGTCLADLVVTPSVRPEAFGRVTAEALAMETPVVASDLGASPEIVRAPHHGLLIPPGDHDALARAIRAILFEAPPETRAAMGAAGRRFVLETCTKASLQRKTLQLYADLVSEDGEPRREPTGGETA